MEALASDRCSLRGQAAVDHHPRSGHEAGVVGRQEHDAERDVFGDAEPPDRMLLQTSLLPVCRTRDANVCAPMSVSITP